MASTRTLVALLASATLALTGCGAVGGGDDGKLDYEDSPLSRYLTEIFSGGLSPDATPQEVQAFYDEQNRKTEKIVAECMTEQGFDYVPNVNNGGVVIGDDESENMYRPDERDWVEKYGYGVINSPWQDKGEVPEPEATQPVDPNEAYVQGLTEAEREAYYEALHGKPIESEPGDEEAPEYNWENQGCYGRAYHEVQGDNPWELEENKPLIEALEKFWQSVQNDPGFAKLDADWAACMTDAGYAGFKKQGDAQESIYELTNKYWEGAPQGEGEQDPTFGTIKDPEYAKIADQEIPLALADLGCREKTDYRQQQLKIQFAAEEQFIADHKEELEAMKARAEQGRKK
ncbi:MAG: hypothetical protein QM804_06385 [Propionicimonas sp.]